MKKTNIARLAVTAGLTLAMGAGMMAPATVAFAADAAATGNITINQVTGNSTTFTGYQIFTGKVEEVGGQKKVSDLDWANNDVKAAVESVAKKTFNTAQDGADWITQQITGTDSTTAVEASSTANALAKAVSGVTTTTTVKPDTATNLSAGYWLFVTTPNTAGNGESATAPIFAVVGGKDVNVTEKDSVPTVTKTVDNGQTSGSTHVGDTLSYKIEGTVSSDIATFKTYQYVFTDTLSAGLDYQEDAKVTVDGTDVTSKATVAYDQTSHKLTVTFNDLKTATTLITKDSKVDVTYTAKVNANAAAGQRTNLDNTVKLTYSNDPHTSGTGTTTNNPTVREYTYKLKLVKCDRDTEKALNGATFTIKNSDGKYVQSDGSLGDAAYTFTANGDDGFMVNGLDAGTYTVEETAAPNGYQKTGKFTFTITPTISTSGDNKDSLTGLDLSVDQNSDVIAGTPDGTTGNHQLQPKTGTAADVTTGIVTVTVGDKKEITMPLTGMKGTTALMVYGSAILVISAAAYLKHKRNASNDDAE
ncbi:isopeptide-forming domain-containing fimbrial protein [Olsenella sp. YH-ols2221]|uniref:isopeptide-forming domain-containing fimbrial protein n=1 Tax=Olsenella kribbiana TaxID=3115221 RepID=UPI002ED99B27